MNEIWRFFGVKIVVFFLFVNVVFDSATLQMIVIVFWLSIKQISQFTKLIVTLLFVSLFKSCKFISFVFS